MFKHYSDNEQFNLQINRFINDEYEDEQSVQDDVAEIVGQLKDTETWYQAWLEKAQEREEKGDWEIASTYYQAAEFYLGLDDPRSKTIYDKYRETFYKGYHDFKYEQFKVPYEQSYLPVTKLINPGAKKDLLLFAGYDSYMEEMVKMSKYLKGIDYNIYVLDGPGQGTALRNGLKLIHNWEKPISTIINYFEMKNVSVIGMSLGGYLVMRAAAFDKRITKIAAFDIFYSFMDALRLRLPYQTMTKIEQMLKKNEREKLNALFQKMMSVNLDLNWKINKGIENTGVRDPFTLLKEFQKYNVKSILPFINQDVLLLVGEDDQYVPSTRLPEIEEGLINAGKVKTVIFTKETGGEQHCQAGHRELGFNAIKEFLA
ncbi:alpha/beta fold hydrolase [Liquorilactobacillus satsumensis]|uniref:alpha/beta fold hydrolase n=1 Tax=Liquorilactobacillus TaxID=2767888 RepID=UPI001E542B83|nr:alpha/beta hydrolase [Liquorilactobacillus satsumensis]MCC7666761.1 alpha/beta hydrolase [Liquorilactobacillus satsumensis]